MLILDDGHERCEDSMKIDKIYEIESKLSCLYQNVDNASAQLQELSKNFEKINIRTCDDIARRDKYEQICISNRDNFNTLDVEQKEMKKIILSHDKLHKEYSKEIFGFKDFFTKEIYLLKEQTTKEIAGLKEINIAQINIKKGFVQATGLLPKIIAFILSIAAAFYAYEDHNRKESALIIKQNQQIFDNNRTIHLDEEKAKRYLIKKGIYEK